MNTQSVRKLTRQFHREFHLLHPTYEGLRSVFEQQGFIVIEFHPYLNNEDVQTVVNSLNLQDLILQKNGFLYMDHRYRLVFVNEQLSQEEKLVVLAHEEGHYYCNHIQKGPIVGLGVMEEYEANEFAHYLLKAAPSQRIREFCHLHRRAVVFSLLLVLLGGFLLLAFKSQHDRKLYEGNYYVTLHGTKYHLGNCVTIQGHQVRRLTKKDVASGKYEPCSVCLSGG